MSTVKVTVTLGTEELAQVRALVERGQVANVSAFVQHAVRQSLEDRADFIADLREALELTGGPATPEEKAWASAVLSGEYATEVVPEFPRSPGRTMIPAEESRTRPELEAETVSQFWSRFERDGE